MICFNLSVDPNKLANRKVVHLGSAYYNEKGTKIVDEEITLDWQSNFDRLSKTFHIRGKDGSVVPTGKYRVEFWVDESIIYEYNFTVTSNEELQQQQRLAAERQRQQYEQLQMYAMQWRTTGKCQHCGGTFKKGWFATKCISCGRPKDY